VVFPELIPGASGKLDVSCPIGALLVNGPSLGDCLSFAENNEF